MSKDAVDDADRDMREGLAYLQLMIMVEAPGALAGAWSPILLKIASCKEVVENIVDLMIASFKKQELMNETRGLLIQHIGYLTPATLWCLDHEDFKKSKLNQHVRLKTSFAVHSYDGNFSNLSNLAATLKSPVDLIDAFLK